MSKEDSKKWKIQLSLYNITSQKCNKQHDEVHLLQNWYQLPSDTKFLFPGGVETEQELIYQ